MVMVTRSYPTDHALAPSRVVVVGAGGPPSPTDLSAGDKCVSLVVHAAFNVVGTYTACCPSSKIYDNMDTI